MKPAGDMHTPRGRGRSSFRQSQDLGELRRPHSATTNAPGLASPDPGAGGDVPRKTALSPDAKEFFPKGYVSPQFEDGRAIPPIYYAPSIPHWASGLALQLGSSYINCSWSPPYPNSIFKCPGPGGDAGPPQYPPNNITSQEPFKMNHLLEVMDNLTLNPGRFDVVIEPLASKFGHYNADDKMMHDVINAIVQQSITEPNFRYNGARLCVYLRNASNPDVQLRFRHCLLCRCQEENSIVPILINSCPSRVHGYTLFLAELYIQLDISSGTNERISILGSGLISTLSTLLAVPTPDNIKCACQALKLAGHNLEKQDPHSVSKLFQDLSTNILSTLSPESNIHFMVNNVIHLRQCAWGSATSMPQADVSLHNQSLENEPVFYGPDGQILTAEEQGFLQDNIAAVPETEEYDEYGENGETEFVDEEEDEEFNRAYAEFLKMSNQTTKT